MGAAGTCDGGKVHRPPDAPRSSRAASLSERTPTNLLSRLSNGMRRILNSAILSSTSIEIDRIETIANLGGHIV
jgi:hypothetical protein